MLHNAFLASIDDVIVQGDLREDLVVLDFRMRCSRDASGTGSGSAWTVEIEIPNPGWAPLFVGTTSQYIAFIESTDGTMATANVLAKGRLLPLEGEANSQTIKVKVVCAPINIQGLLFAYAQANLATNPQFDKLYEDVSFSNIESYMEATSGFLVIDPVTHAISVTDVWDADRTVNIGTNYDWGSVSMVSLPPPYTRARLTVTCEFDQYAKGITNIAGIFGTGLSTLNPNFMETADRGLPGGLVDFNLGTGWKLDRNTWSCSVAQSGPIYTGRRYVYQTQDRRVQYVDNNGNFYFVPAVANTYTDYADEVASFNVYSYYPFECWMEYDYKQPRRETVTILVSLDLQPVVGVVAEKDLGGVALSDLLTNYIPNPTPPPDPDEWGNYIFPYTPYIQVQAWNYETVYNEGDRVELNGNYYQANKPTQGFFYKVDANAVWQNPQPGQYSINLVSHADWDQVPSNAAIPDGRQPNFADSDRGRLAIEHGILRCRAFLRKNMQAREVTVECLWDDAIGITTNDRVRVELYANGIFQPVVGKVAEIERHWGWEGKTVRLKLAVPLGTGANVAPDPTAAGSVYADESYFGDQYIDQNTLGYYALGDDVQYTVAASTTQVPVDAFRLQDPLYSVFQYLPENLAGQQFAEASAYAARGEDPRDAVADYPTFMTISMRALNSNGTIERLVDVAATITVSPRGLDLSTPGGEP